MSKLLDEWTGYDGNYYEREKARERTRVKASM